MNQYDFAEPSKKGERMEIYTVLSDTECPGRAISVFDLESIGFFDAPASTQFHGAYPGGLFDHSLAVYRRLDKLTKDNRLVWKNPYSPFVVGMYHDLCKCDQYTDISASPEEPKYEYNKSTLLAGHATKSIMLLSTRLQLTEEEMLCIRYHMGAYETDDWDGFDKAIRKYSNVLWTHHADMLASKVDGI